MSRRRPNTTTPAGAVVVDFTDGTFAAKVAAPSYAVPVVVMYWMTGCGHCHAAMPRYLALARREAVRARFCRGNARHNRLGVFVHQIEAAPTFVIVQAGVVTKRFEGDRVDELARFVARLPVPEGA